MECCYRDDRLRATNLCANSIYDRARAPSTPGCIISLHIVCVCVCWTHQVSRRSFLMLFCIRGAFFVFDAVQMKIGRFNKNKVCKVSNLLVSFHIFLTKGFKRAHEGSWTAEGDIPPPTEDN